LSLLLCALKNRNIPQCFSWTYYTETAYFNSNSAIVTSNLQTVITFSVHCVHIDYSSDVFILLFVSLHFRYLKLLSLVICSVFIFVCNDYNDRSLKRTFSFCRKTISLCYSGRLRNFVEILIRWGVSWSQYLSSTIYIMNLNENTQWMIHCVKQVWDWQGHCRAAVGSEPWKRVRSPVSIQFFSY